MRGQKRERARILAKRSEEVGEAENEGRRERVEKMALKAKVWGENGGGR